MRIPRRGSWRRLAPPLAILMTLVIAGDAFAVTWSGDRELARETAWAWPGSLAVSSSTLVHSVYDHTVAGTTAAWYRRSTNSGTTWSLPVQLSRSGVGQAAAASIDAYGSALNAVWVEGDPVFDGLEAVVVHRQSTDGGLTWGEPQLLSAGTGSAGPPKVARRGTTVVVTWTNEITGAVYARVSTNGGTTFRTAIALATTTRVWGGFREGFPAVGIGTGVMYVAYYSATKTLRIRRSTDGGVKWATAVTLSTVGDGYAPSLAAYGSTAIVGYAGTSGSDRYTVIRRTTDKGAHWGSPVSLNPLSSYKSWSPVLAVRGTRWMAAYEKCLTSTCSSTGVYYRASTNGGSTWSTASKASVNKRKYEAPADVDVATKTLILYVDYDTGPWSGLWLRQGS